MRFRAAVAICAAVIAVAGCGNLPRPFSPEVKTASSIEFLPPADGAGVVVDGAACPLPTEALVEALRQRQVPATAGPGNLGSMRLVCEGDGAGQSWLLISAENTRLGEIPHDTPDGVAQRLLALIGRDAPPPPEVQLPALVVMPVAGAPGDGAVALTRAMALALKGRGAVLALEPNDTALLVMGSVVVTDSDPGSQFIEVIWELLSPDGARLGIVSQENTIDAGALDGPWGPIAPVIASAGADGVIDLIERTLAP